MSGINNCFGTSTGLAPGPGGVTLAVTRRLIEQGRIDRGGSTVVCITGNGLKTQEALDGKIAPPVVIRPTIEEFEALIAEESPAELVGAGA